MSTSMGFIIACSAPTISGVLFVAEFIRGWASSGVVHLDYAVMRQRAKVIHLLISERQ
jgi:cyanate permease